MKLKFEIFGKVVAVSISPKREPRHARQPRHAKP